MRNTRVELKMLNMINDFINKRGYSPNVRELAEIMDIKSVSTAQRYLNDLEMEGYITKDGSSAKTIRVLR